MTDWFTSDFHFNHANIIKYSGRPFASIEEMDSWLISNVNATAQPGDRLFFLGDWLFPGRENYAATAKRYRNQINCKTIFYVWGNHDQKGRGNHHFTSLFNSCHDLLEITSNGQKIVLCHYAMRVWNKSHHGSWHLYGHSHASLPDDPYSLSLDCGVDAAAAYLSQPELGRLKGYYRPMSFDEIKAQMAGKAFKPIDHHGDTNERPILD